jgi:GTP cyclohydrolase II
MIIKLAEERLKTKFGEYTEMLFYDGKSETIAMIMGNVSGEENILCRLHSSCIYGHAFNSIECDCREQMEMAQQLIQEEGKGIIIWLEHEGKGNGHFALMKSKSFKRSGLKQGEAYEAAGFQKDARDFSQAAAILKYLGVKSIQLITNSAEKVESLTRYGIDIVGIKS